MGYREHAPRPSLRDLVACTWQRDASAAPAHRVVPDACVDLIWAGSRLFVAGPDTGPFVSTPPPGGTVVGLRLRPGAAGRALGLPASELRDARVDAAEVWGRAGAELAERVAEASGSERRRAVLEDALLERRPAIDEPDPLVQAAARRLGLPGTRVRSLSRELAVSERQLLRRFTAAVGYGPKTLDRVLRFQRLLARGPTVAAGEERLARIAAELGYADQAHLTRECVRLSGTSPTRLLAAG